MSQMYSGNSANFDDGEPDELEQLLVQGFNLDSHSDTISPVLPRYHDADEEEEDDVMEANSGNNHVRGGDFQGAAGLFAEAAQDMATASLELSLGRHFACADFCNQAVEKAAQAVSLLRFARRSTYDHDLRTLGASVGAPAEIQDEMATLTPFHPESFYVDTPPEEADEVISAEQAATYVQSARHVLRWARGVVLNA
jgi:HEPN domain-containing protein